MLFCDTHATASISHACAGAVCKIETMPPCSAHSGANIRNVETIRTNTSGSFESSGAMPEAKLVDAGIEVTQKRQVRSNAAGGGRFLLRNVGGIRLETLFGTLETLAKLLVVYEVGPTLGARTTTGSQQRKHPLLLFRSQTLKVMLGLLDVGIRITQQPIKLLPVHPDVLSDLFVEDLVGPSRTNLLFAGALHVLELSFLLQLFLHFQPQLLLYLCLFLLFSFSRLFFDFLHDAKLRIKAELHLLTLAPCAGTRDGHLVLRQALFQI
mmetsp:Transcript_29419/g.63745  ORF Transcript_29419/g.63745 Transcript_29419/m.63745 type:complete len:267 (+) Transcript_29419:287-1087(+)